MNYLFSNQQNDNVKRATSDLLSDVDIHANLRICDDINNRNIHSQNVSNYHDKLKNYQKSLYKRIKLNNNNDSKIQPITIYLSYCLLESISKNCKIFIDYIADPYFVNTIHDTIVTLYNILHNTDNNNNNIASTPSRKTQNKQRYYTSDQLHTLQLCYDKAIQLIYELSIVFGRTGNNRYPIFTDIYNRLTLNNIHAQQDNINTIQAQYRTNSVSNNNTSRINSQVNSPNNRNSVVNNNNNQIQTYNHRPPTPSDNRNSIVNSNNSNYNNSRSIPNTPSSNNTQQQHITPTKQQPYIAEYSTVTTQYIDKIKNECNQTLSYLQLLTDMLYSIMSTTATDNIQDISKLITTDDGIQSIYSIITEIKNRITTLIVELNDEYLLNLTIEVHTYIHTVLTYYDSCVQNNNKTFTGKPYIPTDVNEIHDISTALLAVQDSDRAIVPSNQVTELFDLSMLNDALPESTDTTTAIVPVQNNNNSNDNNALYDMAVTAPLQLTDDKTANAMSPSHSQHNTSNNQIDQFEPLPQLDYDYERQIGSNTLPVLPSVNTQTNNNHVDSNHTIATTPFDDLDYDNDIDDSNDPFRQFEHELNSSSNATINGHTVHNNHGTTMQHNNHEINVFEQ